MLKKDSLAWVLVCTGCIAVTSVAFIYLKIVTGSFLPSILPELEADSLYYLTQVKEILDGHPMLGNPYIIEYANASFAGLLLPLWITALPGYLGFTPNVLFAFNAFLFSIITGALFYLLSLRLSSYAKWTSVAVSVLGVASLHNLLIRPAIMQTIYPSFALFALALLGVLQKPHNTLRYAFLGFMAAFSFYLYPYLWMITFSAIGLLTLKTIWKKDWAMLKKLLLMGIGIIIICAPQILTTISLFADSTARELNDRIGLVETHRILPLTILNNKYTILFVVGLIALHLRRKLNAPESLLLILGLALLCSAFSNVITGKEMHFHNHFWRIAMFITIIGIPIFMQSVKSRGIDRIIASVCLAGLLLTTINRVAIRSGGFVYLKRPMSTMQEHRDIQAYKEVFTFFESQGISDAVVHVNESIGRYIPLYTKNYVYYADAGRLNTIPTDEIRERFLVHYVDAMNRDFLVEKISSYIGIKPIHQAAYERAYGNNVDAIDLLGGDVFLNTIMKEHAQIDVMYDETLTKRQVDYVVIDENALYNVRLPKSVDEVYSSNRFTIYKL